MLRFEWMIVAGVIVALFLLWLDWQIQVRRIFVWAIKYRCPITGKIFRDNCHCTEPCPCHGEKKVSVLCRWRIRGWQVKETEYDRELEELRRLAGMR